MSVYVGVCRVTYHSDTDLDLGVFIFSLCDVFSSARLPDVPAKCSHVVHVVKDK